MIILKNIGKKVYSDDPQTVGSLAKGKFGIHKKNKIYLFPEEAMYLIDIRNAKCPLKFTDLMKKPSKYYGYKAWKDRGLYLLDFKHPKANEEINKVSGTVPVRKYTPSELSLPDVKIYGKFYKKELMTIVEELPETPVNARYLYYENWFGQLGTYKAEHRGKFYYLDIYETLFLMDRGILSVDIDRDKIINYGIKKHKFFDLMYNVYEDWRSKGFILKTGFKFGSHFRLYFPGAAPKRSGKKWMHSKHVVHVFPYKKKLLISEWSRAIRVAHSVRKTFILAIPKHEKDKMKNVTLDYILYHRKKNNVKKPFEDPPSYVMWCLSEEEYIGGAELAYALNQAKKLGLGLMLSIADRETSVTFYRVLEIALEGSKYEYYEIEWVQP